MKKNILILTVVALFFGACKDEEVEVFKKSARIITSYKVDNQYLNEVISYTADSGLVQVFVEPGTDLSNVTPQITISDKATISPASGTPVDFSSGPVTYTITAETGLTIKWKVIAMEYVAPAIKSFEIDDFDNVITTAPPANITVYYAAGTDISAVTPVIGITPGSTITPTSGSPVNFAVTNPQIFTVKHPTGASKAYTVRLSPR